MTLKSLSKKFMENDLPRAKFLAKRTVTSIKEFINIEVIGGIILLASAAIALIWANSPIYKTYDAFWHTMVSFKIYKFELSCSLHFIINEILMTLFFLVVGLEIRYEIYNGSLNNLKQALLPIMAAIGGVIVPALIYLLLNKDPLLQKGWAVPTATDIAFAVGVLSLIKNFTSSTLKAFLLTLAIIDDIIAIIIIAIFYSSGINYDGFLIAALGLITLYILNHLKINYALIYTIPSVLIWYGLFLANIHPTLAGVIVGLMMPVQSIYSGIDHLKDFTIIYKFYQNSKLKLQNKNINLLKPLANQIEDTKAKILSLSQRTQEKLHPWVAYVIMPLFALANAGINISNVNFNASNSNFLIITTIVSLIIGKPLGIISVSLFTVKTGLCKLPQNISWQHIILVGLLAGIGFTMSIFIAMLGFKSHGDLLNASKFAVLIGSLLASILGVIWGKICTKLSF